MLLGYRKDLADLVRRPDGALSWSLLLPPRAEDRVSRDSALTASIGVPVFPRVAAVAGGLLRAADAAIYRSQAEGRNAAFEILADD